MQKPDMHKQAHSRLIFNSHYLIQSSEWVKYECPCGRNIGQNSVQFKAINCKMCYSGNNTNEHRREVDVVISKKREKCIEHFVPNTERAPLLQINVKPLKLSTIQAYASTVDSNVTLKHSTQSLRKY
uniref:Uncharacterized protein n=1 Tax=Glossina austeni TaxID=7395 RepID=A0A1A9VIE9_GLOAU